VREALGSGVALGTEWLGVGALDVVALDVGVPVFVALGVALTAPALVEPDPFEGDVLDEEDADPEPGALADPRLPLGVVKPTPRG
jgi:hypothetical protein